ncbi:MAG TPA: lanthionine synthetase LanC family protein, partial [Thermoanaerobaculia bacterium]|nr:lanthionine synthetase LanC family protein [Thermoanaerobaculia bacterium]
RMPQGNYNLGVAHGVPGIVAALAGIVAAGVAQPRAGRLLEEAVAWMLAEGKLPPGAGAVFPSHLAPGASPKPSRQAWCYGDPGIAAALLGAARQAGEPSWEREALETARSAAACSREAAGIKDAGLCHGAAGLGHLWNRLWQASGEPVFADTARAWFEWTLDFRQPGRGSAGFLARDMDDDGQPKWVEDTGFLTGTAGIGLTLLGALFPIEPAWDRVLLVSIPSRRA